MATKLLCDVCGADAGDLGDAEVGELRRSAITCQCTEREAPEILKDVRDLCRACHSAALAGFYRALLRRRGGVAEEAMVDLVGEEAPAPAAPAPDRAAG